MLKDYITGLYEGLAEETVTRLRTAGFTESADPTVLRDAAKALLEGDLNELLPENTPEIEMWALRTRLLALAQIGLVIEVSSEAKEALQAFLLRECNAVELQRMLAGVGIENSAFKHGVDISELVPIAVSDLVKNGALKQSPFWSQLKAVRPGAADAISALEILIRGA